MWISHDGKLYNLAHVVSIRKVYDDEIRLQSQRDFDTLFFDNVTLRDEYYQHIQRLVFNLGPSV